ncbi:membrane protein [Lysinibacillus contaminans]|uniref:Membrane protein n=1 Tax=Lysinibacillus contaminans TaxID=1293441 RepID=A0ABR5K204_9BACI|nr:hypothetical protein [Lysinibacillus contaminans]KOS68962.1 membrane protein [Lysinibacillus contaminans]
MSYDTYYSEFDEIMNDPIIAGLFLMIIFAGLIFAIIAYLITALIYFKTSKTNGFSDVAYIAWIPLLNVYSLFLLSANSDDNATSRALAKRNTLIYLGLFIVSLFPLIGFIASLIMAGFILYYSYRLMYRWSGETGKAVLYVILSIITGGLFFAIYGLMRMNQPFKA